MRFRELLEYKVPRTNWYIMNARGLFKSKVKIEDVIEEMGSGAIIVAEKDGVKIFVYGSGKASGYGKVGDTKTYTVDTGNGYGKQGEIRIENLIDVDKNKEWNAVNKIGISEKRSVWVQK